MSIQLQHLGLCHSPFSGEGVALRPDWEQQYRDSHAPFVSKGDETTV
jgi:hypothetical protein